MHWRDCFRSLYLDDELTAYKNVQSVTNLSELDSAIHERDRNLGLHITPGLREFIRETCAVGTLQKPWAERAVHTEGAIKAQPS